METKSLIQKLWIPFLGFIMFTFVAGCSQMTNEPDLTDDPKTDKAAFEVLAEEDSSVFSFYANYNEEDAMIFGFGKVSTEIYPKRVGQRVRLISRNIESNIVGDTAYATVTLTFEGKLFIGASFDSTSTGVDTIIQKNFTSQIKRNLIFIRIGNSPRPRLNWKLAAVSLPMGGTLEASIFNTNIRIEKLTLNLPNNNTLVITSPLDYYLWRNIGGNRPIPSLARGQQFTIEAEIYSAYEIKDFVTVTFGADRFGQNRTKVRLELVSSTPGIIGFTKIYRATINVNQIAGHFHAVINAMPHQVIFDSDTNVETSSWGMPYHVRR